MLLVHFVDNTMQIATSEQEVAITLDILVRHLHIRGRGNKSDKTSEASSLSEISGRSVV